MRFALRAFVALTLGSALSGCDSVPSAGLVLPEGDASEGRELFVDFHCHSCHVVRGVELPSAEFEREHQVSLGVSAPRPTPISSPPSSIHRIAYHGATATPTLRGRRRQWRFTTTS